MQFRKGEAVIRQGEAGDRMFVIISGAVKIFFTSSKGEIIEIVRRRAPENFGELALLDNGPRSATVETTEKTSVIAIERTLLIGLMEREPKIINPLLTMLGQMLRENIQLNNDLAFFDIRARLTRRLIELTSKSDGNSLTHRQRVSQTELAHMVSGSRQTVNTILHAMADEGLISISSDGIRVLSPEGLRAALQQT